METEGEWSCAKCDARGLAYAKMWSSCNSCFHTVCEHCQAPGDFAIYSGQLVCSGCLPWNPTIPFDEEIVSYLLCRCGVTREQIVEEMQQLPDFKAQPDDPVVCWLCDGGCPPTCQNLKELTPLRNLQVWAQERAQKTGPMEEGSMVTGVCCRCRRLHPCQICDPA